MNKCETSCFAFCVMPRCAMAGMEDLNAEAVQLAATIEKNFEELGV